MSDATSDLELWNHLPGGAACIAWFKGIPDFHDAEVLEINLRRTGISRLVVLTLGHPIDADVTDARDCIVTFGFTDIVELELEDFSSQNVIGSLQIRRVAPPPQFSVWPGLATPPRLLELTMDPCFGLHGRVRAHGITMSLDPAA